MTAAAATDVLVVGGGIAGVSAAYALAPRRRVTLIEREPTLSYHTTGRSAAQFSENYGARSIRALAKSSRLFLHSPPPGLMDGELLSPRGGLWIGRPDQMEAMAAQMLDATKLDHRQVQICARVVDAPARAANWPSTPPAAP